MSNKANLLSIGDLSKYSGASIRSLRYYEQMKILTPAYVNSDTGYRYYSVDQLQHVGVIMFCIELGITLKELARLADADDAINVRTIVEQGKALAEEKLKALNNGLRFFETIERQMDLFELYPKGQVYPKKIEEKTFYVRPCDKANLNQLDLIKAFMEMPLADSGFDWLMEYGVLYEHSPTGVEHFVFAEIPKSMEVKNTKKIPAGIYFCSLNDSGQIDRASEVFNEQLSGKDSFLAIEMEIMADKYEMGKPFFSELRVKAI